MLTTNDQIHLAIQFATVSLAVTANITFLIVILKRTPPAMRTFSIFLTNTALIDLITAVAGGITCERVIGVPDGTSLNVFIGPCTYIGKDFCLFTIAVQAVLHNVSSWLLLLSFIYKLFMLVVSYQPDRYVTCSIWTLCLATYAIAFVQIYLFSTVAEDVPSEIVETFNISGYTALRIPRVDNIRVAVAILPTALVSPMCMLAIVFIRLRLQNILQNIKDQEQHRSVIKTLTYQAMLPMGSLLGTTYWAIDTVYQLGAEWPGRFLMMTACFICLASPLINLFCLPPYRRALLGARMIQKKSNSVNNVITITNQKKFSDAITL